MVTKTEQCHFSEYKIYPGRGHKFVRKDGKSFFFLSKKTRKLHFQNIKASQLTWTPMWRRKNRKGAYAKTTRTRTKRTTRKMKAIVGMSLAEINRIRSQGEAERAKIREKVKEEQKKKKQAQIEAKKAAQKAQRKTQPKNLGKQKQGGKIKRTGF
mmetsp:Transcript_40500/g.46463  ORF Transcript_40500/g.46463 Transcript_40500/m.46463 type:complete len:155 (-) Transcript_40500:35-499(-)